MVIKFKIKLLNQLNLIAQILMAHHSEARITSIISKQIKVSFSVSLLQLISLPRHANIQGKSKIEELQKKSQNYNYLQTMGRYIDQKSLHID